MKFKISEHPSIWLFLISLVILASTIVLNVMYHWTVYAIIAIVLAGLAVVVLGYSMIKDISLFVKQRKQFYSSDKKEDTDED